jgi:hypothetical protein
MSDKKQDTAPIEVNALSKVPGGPWFVALTSVSGHVWLGPYENRAIAQEDAGKLRGFLAAAITHANGPSP